MAVVLDQIITELERHTVPESEKDQVARCMASLRHYECPQDVWELRQMMKVITGMHSLLEVGSSFGGTLLRMSRVLAPDALLVSVDAPIDGTPTMLNPVESLKANCQKIADSGRTVHLIPGNSHAPDVIERTRAFGPFDFGFIDGDHSYEGVRADWENYGPMCNVVGFHDVGSTHGCMRFWAELKAERIYRTMEFINAEKYFGIGIVVREGA